MAERERKLVSASDESHLIEVRVGSIREARSIEAHDDFAKDASELRLYSGVSAALKKRASRDLQKFQRGADGTSTKRNERIGEITGYALFDVVLPPYNPDYLSQLYEMSAPHAAAVKAKVYNIAGLGFEFIETEETKQAIDKAEGNEEKLRQIRRRLARLKQQLLDWIDSCNEEDEFSETLIKVWTDYEVTGNGYIEIGRTVNNEIGYIGHIPSPTMRVRKRRDGFVQLVENRAVFFRNFGDNKTTDPIGGDRRPNEIIHLKKYSPTNNFYGVPDIVAALSAVTGNEFSSRFNLDYFENKAVPRYVIIVKGAELSPSAEQNVLEFFQTTLKGTNHRTLYVPLPADEPDRKVSFEMKPVEAGVQDSSFNAYRKANLMEILMAHRVPVNKVSVAEGNSLAASRDADKTFKEQVCRPEQKILDKKLNKIIGELTNVFKIKLNELSLTDEDTQSKIWERMLRYQVMVPNEIRAKMGMPGRKNGDKPWEPKPTDSAQITAQSTGNRRQAQERSANSPDSSGEARQPKGEGRVTE